MLPLSNRLAVFIGCALADVCFFVTHRHSLFLYALIITTNFVTLGCTTAKNILSFTVSNGTIFNSEAVRGFPDFITAILHGLALKALESDPTPLFDVIESYCTIALSGLPLT